MDRNNEERTTNAPQPILKTSSKSPGSLVFDPEKYLPLLEDEDMTAEEAQEALKAIWNILICVYDNGIGIDALELVCGQNAKNQSDSPITDSNAVEYPLSKNQDEVSAKSATASIEKKGSQS